MTAFCKVPAAPQWGRDGASNVGQSSSVQMVGKELPYIEKIFAAQMYER